ncbi:3-hydroxyacyl-ACP dehydratase FabZ [Haloimpatiens sp. FM7315]|uniref:3-hydroxyacyl-ACP dehydratase FabZ n=1 Tax=Haloimpatiens sp. FM7315 TaxID=3298609 RepID=UPI0035A2ABA8
MEDTVKRTLNIKEIMEIIPHRYPFLLVDKVEELEPGIKATGYKNVTMNEYFFQGHFPKEPVMPGVLIIEALAQVGALALLSLEEYKGKIGYFGGINKARFRRKVLPGDVLKLEVEIIKRKGPMGIGKAVATVNGEKAAEAELTFAIG